MYKRNNYFKNNYNKQNTIVYNIVSGLNIPIKNNQITKSNTITFVPKQNIINLKNQNIQY
jgi:hypothetical protein